MTVQIPTADAVTANLLAFLSYWAARVAPAMVSTSSGSPDLGNPFLSGSVGFSRAPMRRNLKGLCKLI